MMIRRGALELLLAGLMLAVHCESTIIGCQGQTIEARSRFVEDGVTKQAAGAEWDGQSVEIENAGVTPTGGLQLVVAGARVSATARMLAIADTEDKANADRAIEAAKASYEVVTNGAVTTARCGHGTPFGSAAAQDSGCDALDVSLPAGTAEKLLMVKARSGTGLVVASLGEAMLGLLDLSGSHGTIEVTVAARAGAIISVVSETGDDVLLRLPADFAADAVVLEAPPDRIDTAAFPDLQAGKRGEPGRGAKSITVRAGRIVLTRQ